jgi:hypothetical protein
MIDVLYADAAVQHIQQFEAGDYLVLEAAGGGGKCVLRYLP